MKIPADIAFDRVSSVFISPAATPLPSPASVQSSYSSDEAPSPIAKMDSGLWGRIALRFGGFRTSFAAVIDPICYPIAPQVARRFFAEKLSDAASLASHNPKMAIGMISEKSDRSAPEWGLLLRIACGDSAAAFELADGLDEHRIKASPELASASLRVARLRPAEGRQLIKHIFSIADNRVRLVTLAGVVSGDSAGSNRLVGDLFIQLMSRSTPEERTGEIYPALIDMALRAPGARRAFLAAMLKGWMSECPAREISERDRLRMKGMFG
ncbi:MAG: hypothetical protein V2A66_10845 [Pseudomonadota bacterium]